MQRESTRYNHVFLEKTLYSSLPMHMQDGARLYVERGIEPGGFMRAVLENNFVSALQRADDINKRNLPEWAAWLVFDCPFTAWGSENKVRRWIKIGGLNGKNKHETSAV